MLRIENISKVFRGPGDVVRAVEGVSLEVGAGEFVAVRGHSGCGKSTLLLAAGGLQHPDSGRVEVCGRDVYAMTAEQRARFRAGHVGFVFQRFHLVPYLSVIENVMTPALATEIADARQRAEELIARLGMGERRGHCPAQLSTGERQRVALARALLARPKLLLADEPTGNLDPENAGIVLDYLGEFAKSGGAVLLVTHDANAAGRAERVVNMQKGSIRDL